LSFQGRAAPDLPGFDEIGGRLRLSGGTVSLGGRIEARAGILEAAATGDLIIAGGATIDAAGVERRFFDQTEYAPGGVVKLSSAGGNVVLASGAGIAIGGGPGGDAGRLIVDAAHGRFVADGTIDAHSAAGTRQGQADLDLGRLDGSFDALAGKLSAAGFAEAQRLRIRSGDVALSAGQTVTAREFALAADGGNLDIGGAIDASGAIGGDIRLAAGGTLTLHDGAVLNASGAAADAAGKGGSVLLAAGDGGRLDLRSGSAIAVGAGGDTGTVHLRAPRTADGTDVAITRIGSGIAGARQVAVEAYKVYDVSVIDGGLIKTDVEAFAESTAGTIRNRFGAGVTAMAGVELRSAGDMTLDTDLDLYALLQTGDGERLAPGVLTLRAGGDLVFKGNLSDGFAIARDQNGEPILDPITGSPKTAPHGGDSWSYRLVAGADVAGADPLALRAEADLERYGPADPPDPARPDRKGSVVVDTALPDGTTRPLYIRTGTGDIDVAAAMDVVLSSRKTTNLDPDTGGFIQPAMIYTAGRPIEIDPDEDGFTPPAGATYPTGGGDITVTARGSLYGVPTAQLVTDYVWRQGDADGTTDLQTSWWIDVDGFQQGVGALGGGNVTLRAGGDISNLSAAIPTVGWVSDTGSGQVVNIRNGGSLTVDALGDIVSGVYYVGRGDATIESGGAIRGGASAFSQVTFDTYTPRTILAVGDALFRLRSRGDLTIETALDPMLLPVSVRQNWSGNIDQHLFGGFFSRGANGAVSLESIGGDVRFGNDSQTVAGLAGRSGAPNIARAMLLYPSALRATAFGGDILIDGGMVLASGDRGTLELLAADDVVFRPRGDPTVPPRFDFVLVSVAMADALPQFEPTPLNPLDVNFQNFLGQGEQLQFMNAHLLTDSRLDQAGRHVGDRDPARIYAVAGDIRQGGQFLGSAYDLIVPKSLQLRAGTDIADLSIIATNTDPGDVTLVQAGRDIDLALAANQANERAQILVGGPGRLEVSAGRNIDLGYGQGILTDGNLRTSVLPDQGADIAVIAGLGSDQQRDLTAFLTRYLDPALYTGLDVYLQAGDGSSIYTAQMIAYVEALTGRSGLDAATAFALFRALPRQQQDSLVQDILFAELRASGREANDPASPRFGATDRGYAAADAMFPGDGYAGGITMRDSQIKTQRGGDISILVPGGGIQLGANTEETGVDPKDENDSGLWTVLGGDIRVFAQDDILIRSSRALTAGGGNILFWSSFGDIDAGAGSRSAVSTAPAIVRLSDTGTLQVEPGGVVSGSGIGALQPPGDVDLYAPNGVVDAGEGGIRVSGNFNVFALQVLNADNIQVGGQTVGLPSAPVNPASIAGVSDVAAQATRAIEDSVREQAQRGAQPSTEPPPLLITGAFLGYEGG
ncbi:filamentous haemagglutinin family protein, partial [Inquilinus sp. CA228]|uniref:filamentous haemagglutinin family protein n=1 Tax=Inquilinus sp. CA228 TaxID=3455609 RepID=UPI003F8D81CF